MARWKLIEAHYLNAVGKDQSAWESKETDRVTGRTARVVYNVPRLLDPKDQADFNYVSIDGGDGGIIVCHQGKGQPRDIVFEGDPTPAMEPLDDEAIEITEACRPNWHDPINEFSAMSRDERMLISLQEQITDIKSKEAAPAPRLVATNGINIDDFTKLQEQVAALMYRNAELQTKLDEKPTRRV